jgi:uncharacterized protein
MLLDFKSVKAGRSEQTFAVPPDDPLLDGFFGRLTEPLEVTARVSEQPHRAYLVELTISGDFEVPCRRCLSPARERVHDRTALLYQVQDPAGSAQGEADPEVLPLRSLFDRVDIGPVVREMLFLAAETFPLCDPGCKGLCPVCGEDLNTGSCDCATDAADPRWQRLQNLRS